MDVLGGELQEGRGNYLRGKERGADRPVPGGGSVGGLFFHL